MAKAKEIKRISDLIPDDNNYNRGTEFGASLIEKSVRKLGAGRSVLADKNGRLIAGNKATEGIVSAGFKDEDIIVVPTDGTKLVVVQRTDLDLNTKRGKELALADNATSAANLAWNHQALAKDWATAETEAWGIFEEETAGGVPDNSLNSEAKEDDYQAPEIETVQTDIVLGDLFEIGPHRLLCGDSTNEANFERLTNGLDFDMVFTDPPYGIDWNTDYTRFKGSKLPHLNYDKIQNDTVNFDPSYWLSVCKKCFFFGANCFSNKLPLGSWIVWDKRFESKNAFLADAEVAWYSGSGAVYIIEETLQGFVSSDKKRFHPTQKPVKLIEKIFDKIKAPNTLVDPFLGSGTTMVAAHQLNRKCYGMELSPKYCQVILDRMLSLDPTIEVKKNGFKYVPKNN